MSGRTDLSISLRLEETPLDAWRRSSFTWRCWIVWSLLKRASVATAVAEAAVGSEVSAAVAIAVVNSLASSERSPRASVWMW